MTAASDEVMRDAVGNVVGVYKGTGDKTLLTGSHYDTVRRAGRFDGRLGIFVPMLVVRELHRSAKRLPFSLEVVGFSEEEGQRYAATFLASGALIGGFDAAWLDQTDTAGVTLRDAMQAAGMPGTVEAIQALKRDASRYLGFVEVHIEQGPVLDSLDLPLGIVTSINGSRRYTGEIVGLASHAGTTPRGQRRDAAAGVGRAHPLRREARRRRRRRGCHGGDAGSALGLHQCHPRPLPLQPGPARHHRHRPATRWTPTCAPNWTPSASAAA